jgi:hypothetical protein
MKITKIIEVQALKFQACSQLQAKMIGAALSTYTIEKYMASGSFLIVFISGNVGNKAECLMQEIGMAFEFINENDKDLQENYLYEYPELDHQLIAMF